MGHAVVIWKRVLKKGTQHLVAYVELYDPVMDLQTAHSLWHVSRIRVNC